VIYLDHAATSHPKPPAVLAAMTEWYAQFGVSAARGAGGACAAVGERVAAVRRQLGTLCGVPADRVVFTSGATEGLNLLLHGAVQPGDHVLTTAFEHASVARPLRALERTAGVRVTVLPPRADGTLPAEDFATALARDPAQWIAFSHASNVTGVLLDAAAIVAVGHRAGARILLDASQTAGLVPLDVGADAVAASAHKALLGPPGLGFLAVAPSVEVRPTKLGGTGHGAETGADRDAPPRLWPARLEAGTPNTPAIFGLGAALALHRGIDDEALQRGLAWVDQMAAALPHAQYHTPLRHPQRVPVLSFNIAHLDPAEAGLLLDSHGIHARVGHHCAPWIHDFLGTHSAGSIRLSPGPASGPDAIRAVAAALGPA